MPRVPARSRRPLLPRLDTESLSGLWLRSCGRGTYAQTVWVRIHISIQAKEVMRVGILTRGVAAVFALLIGLGVGYFIWGMRSTNLAQQLQQQRSEYEYRLSEQTQRAKAAEDRARREAETRKALEEELNRLHPQK